MQTEKTNIAPRDHKASAGTRRALLCGAAGAAVAGTALAAVDPHGQWLAEFLELGRLIDSPDFNPGVELDETPELARWLDLAELIAETMATTPAGVRAQLLLIDSGHAADACEQLAVANAIAALGRMV